MRSKSTIKPLDFKLLFTPTERVAITGAAPTCGRTADFVSIINDTRLEAVDLGSTWVIEGLAYLERRKVLTADRVAEILTGAPR